MDRDDKPVYTEDGHVVSLYVVAFKREGRKMGTIKKKPDEELWYHRIVKNFVLPRNVDLSAQPAAGAGELLNLGIGPEKKKRATTGNVAPKKSDAERSQPSKVKNIGGEKKGTRRSPDPWCGYVVVSDSLEGLTPAVNVRRPKPEPRDTADIPPSNPNDPIDLESSPEHLVQRNAGKRKQADTDAEGQPPNKIQRKKITRKGNLDAFISESAPKTTEVVDGGVEETVEVEKPVDVAVEVEKVVNPEVVDGVTVEEQGSFSGAGKNSPICPEETLGDYYYRTYYEKDASKLHAHIWNVKKGHFLGLARVPRLAAGDISAWGDQVSGKSVEKEKADAEVALEEARSHRERSEQREVQACATLALRDKELGELTALLSDQEQLKKDLELAFSEKTEASHRLTETEEKLENSETARATAESELEPLKSDMAWLKDRGIACVAESVLNSEELDKTVARLVVAARKDGYAQGYASVLSM
ncbi:hypothetical protein HanRHA438_Chr16g0751791 [Helianthus annuus]|nr:hypothetical protein HanRHA438_Chr16g0751791 [Helianthus annuus]